MHGKSFREAAKIAAEFVSEAITKTIDDDNHWYGVKFEKALPVLVRELNNDTNKCRRYTYIEKATSMRFS